MDLTPKQQTSEAVRQAETILITTGQHPSVDQVAAVIGLAMILRKFGKKASAVISDTLPQSAQMLDAGVLDRNLNGLRDFVLKVDVSKTEVDKLRYEVMDNKLHIFITPFKGGFAPSDVTFDYGESQFSYDLVIVLGVPTRARLDRIFEQNMQAFETVPVVNIDFHRTNENYGAVNLIEPNASSLCEMLVALAESLQGGIIEAEIATTLLMGIMASTDRFTATHTTSKSLTVAAQMMAAGARQQAVVKALYRDGRGGGGERGGDRGQQAREPQREATQPRQVASQPAPVSQSPAASQPVASGGLTRVEPRPEPRSESRPEPRMEPHPEPQSAPQTEPPARPERVREELPIIDPGHIELLEPTDGPPAQPMPEMPMADFAAAAEILSQRRIDNASDQEPNEQ